jgi:hypothetical protein
LYSTLLSRRWSSVFRPLPLCPKVDAEDFSPERWYQEYYLAGRPVVVRNFLPLVRA